MSEDPDKRIFREMNERIDEAKRDVLLFMAFSEGHECYACHGPVPKQEWWSPNEIIRQLMAYKERKEYTSSHASLAIYALEDEGQIERGPGKYDFKIRPVT